MGRQVTNRINRQSSLFVIAALTLSMLPQLASMPLHLVLITLLPVIWRLLAEFRNWKPMPMVFRIMAAAAAVAALVMTYGGLMGRRAAVSMLVLMLALKLLETFTVRDARVVVSLSLFLCATQFLFSQELWMVLYIIACVLTALIALMVLQRREAFQGLVGVKTEEFQIRSELGFGLRLMALALPLGIAFFVLFPRWGSPLWGLPENALDAKSGLSDSMSPGSIQGLFMDDSPAFRVSFEGVMPRSSEMYWRGPVFWDFDGSTWKSGYLSRNLPAESRPEPEQAVYRYEVQMEPTEQHWLFALDYPAMTPRGVRMSMDFQLISRRPVTQLKSYAMASDPNFVDNPELSQIIKRNALELPEGFNPRTARLMAQWRSETDSDSEIVARTLRYFNQQEFHYTLNPALLSKHTVDEFLFDTREGFCEHYASAFTVMMRLAGIPARVVTGYQGGWNSDFGSYTLVRQSDAHAWSEVWIKGSGWSRIDPTAAVAPERVEQGSMSSLDERRHLLDFQWLRETKNAFDLLQRGWNQWVIAFDASRQSKMFSQFGWGMWGTTKLVIALIVALLVLSMLVVLIRPWVLKWLFTRRQEPAQRLWLKFRAKLAKAGVDSQASMSPTELANTAESQLKYSGNVINRIVELYLLCRYSAGLGGSQELADLIKRFDPRKLQS
jgi:transglutaminase-like putative cysteine protease